MSTFQMRIATGVHRSWLVLPEAVTARIYIPSCFWISSKWLVKILMFGYFAAHHVTSCYIMLHIAWRHLGPGCVFWGSLGNKLDNGLDCTNRTADFCNGIEIVHHQVKHVGCTGDESSFGVFCFELSLFSTYIRELKVGESCRDWIISSIGPVLHIPYYCIPWRPLSIMSFISGISNDTVNFDEIAVLV